MTNSWRPTRLLSPNVTQPDGLHVVASVNVVEIGSGEMAISQAARGVTRGAASGVISPSITGGSSSAIGSTCM